MTDTAQQENLSTDLIPFISKPEVSMAVASVEGADWTRHTEQGIVMETARVHFQVLNPIHGNLRDGQIIGLPAKRVADPLIRVRHGFDAWNALSLSPGERVILALRPAELGTGWVGVAAQDVSGQQEDVQALERAYAIEEASGDLAAKTVMLQEALRSGQRLLVFYSFDFLRRHAASRDVAVNILTGAINSSPPSEMKLEIGRAITGSEFFVRQAKADSANRLVVSSLAAALTEETDRSRRANWVQLIASCVLMTFTGDDSENREIRLKLTHSPDGPASARVEAAFASVESSVAPEMQEKLHELERIWQNR